MLRVIGGKYKHRLLKQPLKETTRATKDIAKCGLFSSLGDLTNKSFLDAFSGSGAIAIEAISRNAKKVVAIEKDKDAYNIILDNINNLKINEDIKVINDDFYKAIIKLNFTFDIVFIDPPYKYNIDNTFITLLKNNYIINNDSTIIIERENKLDINDFKDYSIKELKYGRTLIYILRGKIK